MRSALSHPAAKGKEGASSWKGERPVRHCLATKFSFSSEPQRVAGRGFESILTDTPYLPSGCLRPWRFLP